MNSILYHQKQREDRKGRKIYIGEDAYPYADEGLIIVADGLGGRGGYPHTKIDPDILDKSLFYDIVFAPVFGDIVSDEIKSFMINSFNEIFETKEYYFEDSNTTRSSGYFASRLVTAIALFELKYNDLFKKENVFSELKGLPAEQKRAVAQRLGDRLAALIGEKLSAIAKNVGFEIETRISGAYLLPSTLTVAMIDEHEEDADVLYFWAGDSRAYIWDSVGLGQVTEDHERDETMTNLITLTLPFRIESRVITVKKPCLLFNATDGCYKCPVFDSPFDLEYIFLKSIDESLDFAAASRYLADRFAEIGRHDDSNTMALLSLGFETYEAIRTAAQDRLGVIDETIISELPGILEINYPAELQQVERQMNEGLFALKDQLIEEEAIASFVKGDMEAREYRPFVKELSELTEQRNAGIARQGELALEIRRWIEKHWIEYPQLKRYSPAANNFKGGFLGFGKKDPYELYSELRDKLADAKAEHTAYVEAVIDKLKIANAGFEEVLASLTDIKQANAFDYNSFIDDRGAMMQVMDAVKSIGKRDTPAMVKCRAIVREITDLNQAYVDFDAAAVEAILNSVILEALDLETIKMHPNELATIRPLLCEYREERLRVGTLESEINALPDKHLPSYWNTRSEELILLIWNEHRALIPEELLSVIDRGMVGLGDQLTELRRCCAVREKIYLDYDRIYRRAYEESKL